jgi:hypothetical protein
MQISSSVEKYLPSLHNLMYNCSSSVKVLTPNNQQEQYYLGYHQSIHKISQQHLLDSSLVFPTQL